jgi:phosphatidylcholine synthase
MLKRLLHKMGAWFVHLFTASGAVFGLLSIDAVYQHNYIAMFWLMSLTVVIDAIDGTFARWIKVKSQLPLFDGALLDNIVDYLNYVIVPAVFLMIGPLLPPHLRIVGAALIVLTSAYQFCQAEAKTFDHFFKGFPSYWNIVLFYLYFWQIEPTVNAFIIGVLAILIFVPIKYVYPSRLEYLSDKKWLRYGMLLATVIWGFATIGLLFIYPRTNLALVILSMSYVLLYVTVSLYKTYLPIITQKNLARVKQNKLSC